MSDPIVNQGAHPPVPPPAAAPRPLTAPAPAASAPDEVKVISHSNIFYWWPVWAVGFIMGAYTWFIDGSLMVTVPKGTETVVIKSVTYEKDGKVITLQEGVDLPAEGAVAPKGKHLERDRDSEVPKQPKLHMASNTRLGVIFCTVLLVVITITNIPLRGMWSVLVIITIALLAVIVALLGWWEKIVTTLSLLDIRINAGGYFFISGVLCGIWAFATFIFDRQTYILFKSNIFIVCQSIGDREKDHPTLNMTVEKLPSDFFRHYILGLGAGDLIVRTTGGAETHDFPLPNVLFINYKKKMIDDLRERSKGASR